MQSMRIEVAPGEVIDKITILEIKAERIEDSAKLKNVRHELAVLQAAAQEAGLDVLPEMAALKARLRSINERLWEIEDRIRDCERAQDFGTTFIELARAVYHTNDERAAVKKEINTLTGSAIVEEKSYAKY